MRANYHAHTPRCRHAVGTEREYAEAALKAGMEILGFSDHAAYDFSATDHVSNIRMTPDELPDYAEAVFSLREEYEGRLELHLGMEAEYYPHFFDKLLEDMRAVHMEYMILGQHFVGNEIGELYCGRPSDDRRRLERYADQCIEAMDTGLFTYFAHPDLINFTGDPALYGKVMRRLCRAAHDRAMPLEINLLGVREKRNYPSETFWRIAGEEGCIAILASDAHQPWALIAPEAEKEGRSIAERFGLTLLETVPFVPLG